jgi:hypothetical protein
VSPEYGNQRISVGGLIRGIRSISTKAGQPMATFKLADLQKSLEVVVFSRIYAQLQAKLIENAIVVVDGRCDTADGSLRLIADSICALEDASDRPLASRARSNGSNGGPGVNGRTDGARYAGADRNGMNGANAITPAPTCRLRIEFGRGTERSADLERIERAYAAVQRFRGADPVEILIRDGSKLRSLSLPNGTTSVCGALERELKEVLIDGADTWSVERLQVREAENRAASS